MDFRGTLMITPGEMQEIAQKVGQASQLNREQLMELQEKNFRKLVTHAVTKSPYYRKVANGRDPDTLKLEDFPPLTKSVLMDNFDDVVTDQEIKLKDVIPFLDDIDNIGEPFLGKYMPLRTSGTTGESTIIVTKPHETIHYSICGHFRNPEKRTKMKMLRFALGGLTGPWRSATFVTMKGRISSGYVSAQYLSKIQPLPKGFTNQWFNLIDPIEKLVEDLNEYQPNSLFAPATMLQTLANEQLEGRLKIKLNMPINAVSTGGEPLHTDIIKTVEKAWGCKIVNLYGTTETGIIARSVYEHNELRHMLDLSILEIVDENFKPVPKGQKGSKVLITNLLNKTQPLIRYVLTDVVGFDAKDDRLPFPRLLPVEGRNDDDFIIYEETDRHIVRPEGFVIFNEVNEIRQCQVIQTGKNVIQLKYRLFEQFKDRDNEARATLLRHIEELELPGEVDWQLERVDSFERLANGKFRRFWNKVAGQL